MKNVQTSSMARGFIAGAYFLLLVMVLLQLSCISGRAGFIRQQSAQMDYSVRVVLECDGEPAGAGSGVMIGGRYVLTARHVVTGCPGVPRVQVIGATGTRYATVDRAWKDRDIVRLRMEGPSEDFWGANRPVVAPLEKLDVVCTAVRVPEPGSACGWITDVHDMESLGDTDDTLWCRDTTFNAEVARGNSGGGLYNARGQLVALITGAAFIPGTSFWIDESFASSLWPIRDEIYE